MADDDHKHCTDDCTIPTDNEMVACSNDSCLREWYHFLCVDLTRETVPKGDWFCPTCQEEKDNFKKMSLEDMLAAEVEMKKEVVRARITLFGHPVVAKRPQGGLV